MELKEDLSGLFIDARLLLQGAADLLLRYAETAESEKDGGRMNRVLSIMEEALPKLERYESAMDI